MKWSHLAFFCTASLCCLASSSTKSDDGAGSPDPLSVLLSPESIFVQEAWNKYGATDKARKARLRNALEAAEENEPQLIANLLRGLDEMESPFVSLAAVSAFDAFLGRKFMERLYKAPLDEVARILSDPKETELIKYLYDMRLLLNVPRMRNGLVGLFYRILRGSSDLKWLDMVMDKHMETIVIDPSLKRVDLRAVLRPLIVEGAVSPKLLVPFSRKFFPGAAIGHGADKLTKFRSYCHVLSMYLGEAPTASEVLVLQSKIDWTKAFEKYEIWLTVPNFLMIPSYFRLSLPIDSDNRALKNRVGFLTTDAIAEFLKSVLFEEIWYDQTGVLVDIRPGVKRYINFLLSHHGAMVCAQAFAMAVCHLYGLDEWKGEAGWSARRWTAYESAALTLTVGQRTVFHGLPEEILLKIGPFPASVSKSIYMLERGRATMADLTYFASKVLRSADYGAVDKTLYLLDDWGVGLPKDEITKIKDTVISSGLEWIDRLRKVVDWEINIYVNPLRQGLVRTHHIGYSIEPPFQIGHWILSLVFGIAPFEYLSVSERMARVSVVQGYYPYFVLLAQTLESMTRHDKDNKVARAHGLASLFEAWLPMTILQDWLFVEYLSEEELEKLIRECPEDSQIWTTFIELCWSVSAWENTSRAQPSSAVLRRCGYVITKMLIEHAGSSSNGSSSSSSSNSSIGETKTRKIALAFGIPESLVTGALSGNPDSILAIFPSLKASEGGFSSSLSVKGTSPSSGHWIDTLTEEQLEKPWLVLLNLLDGEIVTVLEHRTLGYGSTSTLARCLSVSSKNKIIVEHAKGLSSIINKVVGVVLETLQRVYDGWEPEYTIFDGEMLRDRVFRKSIGIYGLGQAIFLALPQLARLRFEHLFFANLRSEMVKLVKDLDPLKFPDIVLPMLLNNRTTKSVGKNITMLGNFLYGHPATFEVGTRIILKREYVNEINLASSDFAHGPGKAMTLTGEYQMINFILAFDYQTAQQNLAVASKAFEVIFKSLYMPSLYKSPRKFDLVIRYTYTDGPTKEVTVKDVTVEQSCPPVALFYEIRKVVKLPFRLLTEFPNLLSVKTIGELELPQTITVLPLTDPKEIVDQLKIIFRLIVGESYTPPEQHSNTRSDEAFPEDNGEE